MAVAAVVAANVAAAVAEAGGNGAGLAAVSVLMNLTNRDGAVNSACQYPMIFIHMYPPFRTNAYDIYMMLKLV